VGINWYEAEAYARWLSAVSGQAFRLPSEQEWEKAARGSDGRKYPWGEQFDSHLCNTQEGHLMTTSPVGLFPGGASPYNILDASGNVWEWTASWYQAYPGGNPQASDQFGERFRVVRGGAWGDYRWGVRCASRFGFVPVYFVNDFGFRLVSPGIFLDSGC
jgi:formylglycine-generating enzyme required for sulfatase activity